MEANANNNPSVTHILSERGKAIEEEWPGCWVRAREKEPFVRSLTSSLVQGVGDGLNEAGASDSSHHPRGIDRGQETGHRASHSRAGTEGRSAELMTDPHLLA